MMKWWIIISMALAVVFLAAPPASAAPDYGAAVDRALTMPARDALRIVDSLSRLDAVPWAVKARCFKILGDYHYVKEDYDKANGFYQQASKPPPAPVSTQPPATPPITAKSFTVQVGAFGEKGNADRLAASLKEKHGDVDVLATTGGGRTLYRVRVGTFARKEDADAYAAKLVADGLSTQVLEK